MERRDGQPPSGQRLLWRHFSRHAPVLKTAVAAGLAWLLASHLSKNQYPYFAPLAVILTLQATATDTMVKARDRVAGIVGGVLVALLIGHWFRLSALTITLAVLIGMGLSTALNLNPQITSQVGVSSLLVLISHDAGHYGLDRIVETLLGELVALSVNALFPPRPTSP